MRTSPIPRQAEGRGAPQTIIASLSCPSAFFTPRKSVGFLVASKIFIPFFFSQHFHANSPFLFFHWFTKNVNWAKIWTSVSFLRAFRGANSSFFFFSLIHQRPSHSFVLSLAVKNGLFWTAVVSSIWRKKKIAGLGGSKIRITPCFSENWDPRSGAQGDFLNGRTAGHNARMRRLSLPSHQQTSF